MAALALISTDSGIYQELLSALEGSPWSVEWIEPGMAGDETLHRDVVVIDARSPAAPNWTPHGRTPVLALVNEGEPEWLEGVADDRLYLPVRPSELRARLERLHAGSSEAAPLDRCSATFSSLGSAVLVLGPQLSIVFANPRACEILGHRPETLGAEDVGRVVSPEDLERVRNALAHGQYPRSTDLSLIRRDGTPIVCSASFAKLRGDERCTVVSFEDVTEQRRTEHELMKTMGFLESLIDATVDAIIATDMEQRVRLFNPSAERISGRHVADVIGVLTLRDLLGASTAELVTQRVLSASYGGEGRLEPTMLDFVDVHGARIPVQLSASLIYEDGEPAAFVLIFADLRDRIRVEQRLAEAQKKLAFTEKQGVLAELAGTAAHELNQPLTSMMAYAELLLRQSDPDSAPAKAARVLIREAERMADIVKKIGKITKYETTAYVGHQKIFDLDRAADAASEPGADG